MITNETLIHNISNALDVTNYRHSYLKTLEWALKGLDIIDTTQT